MPELPEVQTVVDDLKSSLVNQVLKKVIVHSPKQVMPRPPKFQKLLQGEKIVGVTRRAKVLVFTLTHDLIMIGHMKMTGQFVFRTRAGRLKGGGHPFGIKGLGLPNKYTQAQFNFKSGDTLYFNDTRKFGYLKLISKIQWNMLSDKEWGIEPLDKKFTPSLLQSWLMRRPRLKIKQLVMDQKLLAGVGNIYADESLFRARINPRRLAAALTVKEAAALTAAIKTVLKLAIRHRGTTVNDYVDGGGQPGKFSQYLQVYGRAKQPCRKCRQLLIRTIIGGRGTVYCPHCQR